MFEKKQMLPLGSKVTVCYALDGGTESVLVVVGHLSLRNRNACYYDYICVRYPNGIADGIHYINHSDIVRVICRADETDEEYIKWRDKKFIEYEAYYNNYDTEKRADIDTMREAVVHWHNRIDENNGRTRIRKILNITAITCGAGITVLLTGCWWMGLCALLFGMFGYLIKK